MGGRRGEAAGAARESRRSARAGASRPSHRDGRGARAGGGRPGALSAASLPARLAAIVASALAFGLYARISRPWFVLGWVALVPWLATLDRTSSLRGTVAVALGMSVAFVVAVFAWFPAAIADYTGTTLPLAWLLFLLAAPLLEAQLLTFAVARHLLRRRGAGRARTAVAGAAVWVGTEWLV